MTRYPKGARWYSIALGEVSAMIKTQDNMEIRQLFFHSPVPSSVSPKYVVVKPRGRNKWWLFIRHHTESPRLLDTSVEPEGLIMRAVMLPNG